jgi:hypothetical protein
MVRRGSRVRFPPPAPPDKGVHWTAPARKRTCGSRLEADVAGDVEQVVRRGRGDVAEAFEVEHVANIGALVMGERTFEVGEGPWGDDPTFHAPCFVLSHDAREPIGKQGGTTYTFVTDGIERALEQARAAADGRISRSASSSDELEGEDLSHTAATRESGFVRTEE